SHDEWLRKSSLRHPLLYTFDIVADTPELDDIFVQLSDSKGSTCVPVPRLSNRTRIKKIGCAALNGQRREKIFARRFEMENAHFIVAKREPALQMRMSKKRDRRGRIEKAVKRLSRRKNVFVFVAKRSMHDGEPIKRNRTGWKLFQPLAIFWTKLLP